MRKLNKHFGLSLSRYKTFKAMMSVSILVFLICTILFSIFFTRMSKELKSNFLDLNDYLVSIVQTQFQNSLNYSTSVILDPTNQKIINNNIEKNDLYNYSLRLNSFITTNPLVDSLFVYYPEIDVIICNRGVYNLKEFFLIEYGYQYKEYYDSWKTLLIDVDTTGFSYFSDFKDNIYYTRVSNSKNKNSEPNLKQIINFSFNLSGLTIEDNKSFIDELGFLIKDELILIKTNNNENIKTFIENGFKSEKDRFLINFDKSIIYMNTLPYSNINLITSMDVSTYHKSMSFFIFASIITLLLSFLISLFYSLRESKKLFKPFRDLAYKLAPNKYSKDSLLIINDKIDSLLEEETFKDERIQRQYSNLQNLFLLNMLSSSYDEKYCNNIINKYDIMFSYSSFIIFVCEDETIKQIINDSLNELFYDIPCQLNFIEKNNKLVGVINVDEDYDIKDSIIDELENILKNNTISINNISFGLSDLIISLCDIHMGYKQCIYLLNNKKGFNYYTDYTKNIVNDLNEAFKNEDFLLYKKCVEKVFQGNKYMPYDLLITFIKELKQYDKDIIIKCDDSNRVNIDYILTLLKVKKITKDSHKTIIDKVNNIIDKSYKDVNLGLYSISEELGVSNTYISSIYKECCNIGIVQQINNKRIQFAKQLLINTNKSVKEVALESGFSSDISFIRVFKKIEDLTPGKMRKNSS